MMLISFDVGLVLVPVAKLAERTSVAKVYNARAVRESLCCEAFAVYQSLSVVVHICLPTISVPNGIPKQHGPAAAAVSRSICLF